MKKWMRKIRGALGMGLAWAFAWFAAGMVLLLLVGPDAADVPFPIGFGVLGFLAGVTFSGVLGLAAGRTRFDQLSMPRFAGWGGLGGVLFACVFVPLAGLSLDELFGLSMLFGLAAAGSAAGALALARKAEDGARLESGDVDDVGLSAQEKRELLGGGN